MTTPDPKPNHSPFEWKALTINKVERIQLERLRREQDRIEREAQEEAQRRAARQAEQHAAPEALEQAWFEAGEQGLLQSAESADGERTSSPSGRFQSTPPRSASQPPRLASQPPPKPRSSRPPAYTPPAPKRPVSVGLVLAASAFGASVYFSLKWVADVRQANVTRELQSTLNATNPAVMASAPLVTSLPRAAAVTSSRTASISPLQPHTAASEPQSGLPPPTAVQQPTSHPMAVAPKELVPVRQVRPPAPATPVASHAEASPALGSSAVDTKQPSQGDAETQGAGPGPRTRVLVVPSAAPPSQGTRVYRLGEGE